MVTFMQLLYRVTNWLFNAYELVIFVYVLMSWFPGAYATKLGQLLTKITAPYLRFFDRFIPPIGMISISPLIAILALGIIQRGWNLLLNVIFSAIT